MARMRALPSLASYGGAAKPTFEAHMANTGATFLFEYDVTADGKRFLINTTGADMASAPPLTVVTS